MEQIIDIAYAHIPRGNWETFITEEGKYQLVINVQYDKQGSNKQTVPLGDARGEESKSYVQDKPFSLQQIIDLLREDTKELMIKVKQQQSGYIINLV